MPSGQVAISQSIHALDSDSAAGSINAAAAPSSEWTITGVDTKASTDSFETSWDMLRLSAWRSGDGTVIDDLYVCDGTGTTNNDFLGNIYVEGIDPNGDGNSTQLTPSTGSNWQNVDESNPSDGDTTYNTADANSETDLYTMTDLSETGDILGLQAHVEVRVTSGNPRKIRIPVRQSTTTSEGSDLTIAGDDYGARRRILETNPHTASAWTKSEIDSVEVGIKRQS